MAHKFLNYHDLTIDNLIVFLRVHIFRRNVLNEVLRESEVNRLEALTD